MQRMRDIEFTLLLYSHTTVVCVCEFRNAAAGFGVLVLAKVAFRVFKSLYSNLRAFFLAPLGIGRANLLKYGKWAGT